MIYIYRCKDNECRHEQDEVHGMMQEPQIKCNKCGKIMKKKVTGGCGFILKGSGWNKK